MNPEIKKKLFELSSEELIEFYKTLDMFPLFRLNYISETIQRILDIKQVVDKHKEDLVNENNIEIVRSGKFDSTQFLGEYIVLEISSFYSICYKYKKKKNYDLPEIPPYWQVLKDFRNYTSHRDDEEKLGTISEFMEEYFKVDKIGMDIILNDFLDYCGKIKHLFGKKEEEIPKLK